MVATKQKVMRKHSGKTQFTLDKDKITLVRVFDAPRALVWKISTDPRLIPQWWGPRDLKTKVDAWDFKVGGKWRIIQHDQEGKEHPFSGVHKEIKSGQKLTRTFIYEPIPNASTVESCVYEDEGDKTKLTVTITADNPQYLRAMFEHGMADGATQSHDRLQEFLDSVQHGAGKEVTLERTFDAPAELVYKCWTDAKLMKQWFGPKVFTNAKVELDVKPAGLIHVDMQAPNGDIYPMFGRYIELNPPKKLVFTTWAFTDDKGNNPQLQTRNEVTILQKGNRTHMRMDVIVTKATAAVAAALAGMEDGWSGSFDKLDTLLFQDSSETKDREIAMVRVFDAPKELVWKAWTDKNLIMQWWGPRGFTNTINKMEFKEGGAWDFVMHGPDGKDYDNKVTFTKVKPNALIEYDHSQPPFHVTVTLEDAQGNKEKTRLTWRMRFETAKLREATVQRFGALEGLNQTLERLEEMSANLTTKEFVASRTFNAPVGLVWDAFTNPERMKEWWGPKGATVLKQKMDLRRGGSYLYGMEFMGQKMWGKFDYREIVPQKRMVLINCFSDENAGVSRHPMSPSWPLFMLSTFDFEEKQGKTTVTVHWVPIWATAQEIKTFNEGRKSMEGGWSGTFESLEKYLQTQ